MSTVKMRLVGGPLGGQTVWMDEARKSLTVYVASHRSTKRAYEYRREGSLLEFVGEVPPPQPASSPPGTS